MVRLVTSLSEHWKTGADAWVEWARDPKLDDDYWSYHQDAFLGFLPDGHEVVDIGCGEGRLTRALAGTGRRPIGFDTSEPLVRAAARHPSRVHVTIADGARLPLARRYADLAVLFMCLHDMDRPDQVLAEAARVLRSGGHLAVAILSPEFTSDLVDGKHDERYELVVERHGRSMIYRGAHRSLHYYIERAASAGLRLRAEAEPARADGATHFRHLLFEAP